MFFVSWLCHTACSTVMPTERGGRRPPTTIRPPPPSVSTTPVGGPNTARRRLRRSYNYTLNASPGTSERVSMSSQFAVFWCDV